MSEKKKSEIDGKDAFQLFPDIMKTLSSSEGEEKNKKAAPVSQGPTRKQSTSLRPPPPPPESPDISWLWKGEFEGETCISDIPATMLLMPEGENKSMVGNAFEEMGYLVEAASSEQAAVDRMKFVNFAGVVLQTDGREGVLEKSILHNYMKWLPMTNRRQIYYVLIGPDFHTMYDLQALSLSANLVVNNRDIGKIDIILRKGLLEYESLFAPYLSVLRERGKR